MPHSVAQALRRAVSCGEEGRRRRLLVVLPSAALPVSPGADSDTPKAYATARRLSPFLEERGRVVLVVAELEQPRQGVGGSPCRARGWVRDAVADRLANLCRGEALAD